MSTIYYDTTNIGPKCNLCLTQCCPTWGTFYTPTDYCKQNCITPFCICIIPECNNDCHKIMSKNNNLMVSALCLGCYNRKQTNRHNYNMGLSEGRYDKDIMKQVSDIRNLIESCNIIISNMSSIRHSCYYCNLHTPNTFTILTDVKQFTYEKIKQLSLTEYHLKNSKVLLQEHHDTVFKKHNLKDVQ